MAGDILSNTLLGLETALSLQNLLFCTLGVTLGTLIGVIPGIGALTAIAVLFPVTLHLDPTGAIIMLAGIFYGSTYGGAITSILLNVPGTPAHAVTAIDGYPMARNGDAGRALTVAALSSFSGGTIGILLMMFFSPLIATVALKFGPAEYFALILLGMVATATVTQGQAVKGLAMVALGAFLGMVGTDVYSGARRFTFGMVELSDGISLIALTMGLFGVAEVFASVGRADSGAALRGGVSFRSMIPRREDFARCWPAVLRGGAIGSLFGALPGTGGTVAAFVSYSVEYRVSKRRDQFGKGMVEGVAAPEAANNAADQTAFIPTLTLGIPGTPTMALVLGALTIHGMSAGPTMLEQQPEFFWGLVMSFWIGNILLLVLNLPLIGIWVRLLSIPYHYLYPAILVLIGVGTYSVNGSVFDVTVAFGFGLLGFALRYLHFPLAPIILGFVLGTPLEENFRRAMIIARGDVTVILTRPISGAILGLTLLLLAFGMVSSLRARRALS